MIITVTLNPAVDKTVEIGYFEVGKLNRISSVRLDAGGKGINVSKVIMSLGGNSIATGILGGSTGSFIKQYLDNYEIENDFLRINTDTRTNLKVIDSIKKTTTDINEPGPKITNEDLDVLAKKVLSYICNDTVLVLSGSVPANVDKAIYAKWITAAKAIGAKTILDADGELLKNGIQAGPTIVKPNIHELEMLFGVEIDGMQSADKYARSLIEQNRIEVVAVSMGDKGALFLNKEHSIFAHGIKTEVKSTVGAGDAMVAALAFCTDRGCDFEKSIRLATAAATANVMVTGTQPADYSSIIELESRVKLEYLY